MTKNYIHIFHIAIIAGLLLFSSGCGYKAPPVYVDDTKQEASQ